MSTCTPLEHDYIGLSEVSSMPPMTSPKLPSSTPPLDIKETELRLGLPGSHFLEKKTNHLPPSGVSAFGLDSENTLLGISLNPGRNPTSGAKRGFFDAIDGCYTKGGVGVGVVKSQGCVPKAVRKDIIVSSDEGSELDLEKKEDQVSEHGSAAPASKSPTRRRNGILPMARRSNVTELGCIACDELSEIGAGKEGWLVNNPNLLTALDNRSLALATKSLILHIPWSDLYSPRLKIRPELSPIESEHITAIELLVFEDIRVIGVGTSRGYLFFYSLDGEFIHKQIIHAARILRIRVRGTRRDLGPNGASEEVCIVMPGIIARIDGSDIQSMLQRWFQQANAHFWDENVGRSYPSEMGSSFGRLPYQLWNVNKYGACVDTAITGIMPPPLMEAQSSQRYYCAVTIGDDAVISAFRLSEDRNRSIVGAILSKVVPVTFSTIYSLSKRIWSSEQSPTEKSEVKPQPFARASPLTCLKDHPRKSEKLTLSPSGTLAAITDSLGRILLLDTQALVVVRLWKGYRDASCLFMEMLVNRNSGASSSSNHETTKNDYSLCLAIHAPRKGIIEVWQMRTGPRVMAISCAKGCKILQPTYRFGSLGSSPYVPLEVFILNGDSGQISVLNRHVNSR